MTDKPQKLAPYIAVMGPTASGKSSFAIALAKALGGEIINCDSVQFYRGFDIGSAKPSAEDRQQIPHHLFDIVDWQEDFDAQKFALEATQCIERIARKDKTPIIVGGTGLYLRALWGDRFDTNLPKDPRLRRELDMLSNQALMDELQKGDPLRAEDLHPNDRIRLIRAVELLRLTGKPFVKSEPTLPEDSPCFTIYMAPPRALIWRRIEARTESMLNKGLVAEVANLLADGVSKDAKPLQAIGYKQVVECLMGRLPREALAEKIVIATRQYAKRQTTWFNKVPCQFKSSNFEGGSIGEREVAKLITAFHQHRNPS